MLLVANTESHWTGFKGPVHVAEAHILYGIRGTPATVTAYQAVTSVQPLMGQSTHSRISMYRF